jgi:hypothetical protein
MSTISLECYFLSSVHNRVTRVHDVNLERNPRQTNQPRAVIKVNQPTWAHTKCREGSARRQGKREWKTGSWAQTESEVHQRAPLASLLAPSAPRHVARPRSPRRRACRSRRFRLLLPGSHLPSPLPLNPNQPEPGGGCRSFPNPPPPLVSSSSPTPFYSPAGSARRAALLYNPRLCALR